VDLSSRATAIQKRLGRYINLSTPSTDNLSTTSTNTRPFLGVRPLYTPYTGELSAIKNLINVARLHLNKAYFPQGILLALGALVKRKDDKRIFFIEGGLDMLLQLMDKPRLLLSDATNVQCSAGGLITSGNYTCNIMSFNFKRTIIHMKFFNDMIMFYKIV